MPSISRAWRSATLEQGPAQRRIVFLPNGSRKFLAGRLGELAALLLAAVAILPGVIYTLRGAVPWWYGTVGAAVWGLVFLGWLLKLVIAFFGSEIVTFHQQYLTVHREVLGIGCDRTAHAGDIRTLRFEAVPVINQEGVLVDKARGIRLDCDSGALRIAIGVAHEYAEMVMGEMKKWLAVAISYSDDVHQ